MTLPPASQNPMEPDGAPNPEHVCKNCGNHFNGSYCNICGQKIAHRLDIKHVFEETVHVFTHADKGIFPLIPAILFRPGILALEYVQGKRKRYFSIFQYLIIVVGLVTFLMAKTHFMENIANSINTTNQTQASSRVLAVQAQLMGFIKQYLNLFLFILIPIFSFFSWLFFKSKGHNYAENIVLQVVIQAQINTYSLFLTFPMVLFFGKQSQGPLLLIPILILLSCHTVANRGFFKVSWFHALFKGFLVYICTMITLMIMISIIIILLVARFKQ